MDDPPQPSLQLLPLPHVRQHGGAQPLSEVCTHRDRSPVVVQMIDDIMHTEFGQAGAEGDSSNKVFTH